MEELIVAGSKAVTIMFSPMVFGYLLAGIAIGMCIGIIPGLGGLTGMGLLFPFAIGLPPDVAFAFLLGMFAVTTMTDTIPAVLIGVPGTTQSQATYLDGYPMAQRGEAGRALSASYFANIWGSLFGAILFVALLPFLRVFIYNFAAPEYFMLSMLGLVMAASLAGGSVLKGLMTGGLGLLLATVGYAPSSEEVRFAFGWPYLWDGLPLVPIAMGMFALPEVIDLLRRNASISDQHEAKGGFTAGFLDTWRHRWLIARVSFIGAICGMIPGVGGHVAEWLGYGHAVQSARGHSQFGQGDVRGVIAPEASVASEKPAAILPTAAFGIPGNAPMALLLGMFLIAGLNPGAQMLHANLHTTLQLSWTIVLANVIAAGLCLVLQRYMIKLCFLPAAIIAPFILCIMTIGATLATRNFADVAVFAVFGAIGYAMKLAEWPRVPVLIGVVLGGLAERYFHITNDRYDISWLWQRPIVVVILLLLALVLASALWRSYRRDKGRGEDSSKDVLPVETVQTPARAKQKPDGPLGLVLCICALALAGTAFANGLAWSPEGRALPWIAALFLLVGGLPQFSLTVRQMLQSRGTQSNQSAAVAGSTRLLSILIWIGALLIGVPVVGHLIAIPLFLLLFMIVHRVHPAIAASIALVMIAFIKLVLERLLQVRLPMPLIEIFPM